MKQPFLTIIEHCILYSYVRYFLYHSITIEVEMSLHFWYANSVEIGL
jgi:hypothetical protein